MDRPLLHPLVERLRADERLPAFAAALPARARVSEPALPLLLAALLRGARPRRSACSCPTTPTRATPPRRSAGSSARRASRCFPSRGVRSGSGLEPPPHLVGERARALDVLARGGLVCASALALAERDAAARTRGRRRSASRAATSPGSTRSPRRSRSPGYERVERVEERGQFAVRGGLVDVFPTTGREPLRIELFGDEIESIRAFSPFTQRALREVDERDDLPGRPSGAATLVELTLADDEDERRRVELPTTSCSPLDRPPDLVWQPDEVRAVWARGGLRRAVARRRDRARPVPAGPAVLVRRAAAGARRARALRGRERARRPAPPGPRRRRRVRPPRRGRAPARTCCGGSRPTCSRRATSRQGSSFAVAPARRGFVWRDLGVALLPDTQVFRRRPPRATAPTGRALASFSDLRTGDYVVHEDHGIAQLLGFETKEVAGVTRDYLLLGFRGDDRVFVPHEQIGKVSRYIGADSQAPTLSKLGGKAWDNLKNRAREHLREMAGELLQLYAERQTRPGVAYDVEQEWVERLEAEFPYRETEDQARAIEAVKEDLEAPRPMDRLVCGDVGFGKTEVALRAAFTVAVAGKQVLMLVPTTILAQQHWNTFRERYRDFPVRVEMVSRFRKPAEVKRVLAEFGEGKVDVLIGTHRVLSRDVIPKDLGLVVVDEEQRFGVAQKELLRQLRLEVDVLALSARRRSRARCTCRSPACATSR